MGGEQGRLRLTDMPARPAERMTPFVEDLLGRGVPATTLSAERRHSLAVGLILCSGLSMAGMMTALKLGAGAMSLWQILVLKGGLSALCLLPIFRVYRIRVLPSEHFGLYGVRVGCAACAVTCWIYSIAHLPLGVATALSFAKGLFVLWLAALFLAERITALKLLTTLAGGAGVLLVLDLSGSGTWVAGGIGILGALFAGFLTIVIKRLSATEPTLRMMFFPHAGIALVFLVPAFMTWEPMTAYTFGLILAVSLLGTISQWCFISAYRLSEVSALAPVEYSRLVIAVLTGLVIFAEVPTLVNVAGMALIAAASYAAFRFGAPRPV